MQYVVLLNSSANFREAEAEEQTRFIMSIIEALEVPFEWNANEPLSILDRIRLRKVLSQYNISVIDDMDGGVKMFLDRDKIAEWHKALFILKEDPSQVDPKKKLFVEMKCSFSSIFDEEQTAQ